MRFWVEVIKRLNPVQDRNEYDQRQDGDLPDAPYGDELAAHGAHVENPEGYYEEGQVTEQED